CGGGGTVGRLGTVRRVLLILIDCVGWLRVVGFGGVGPRRVGWRIRCPLVAVSGGLVGGLSRRLGHAGHAIAGRCRGILCPCLVWRRLVSWRSLIAIAGVRVLSRGDLASCQSKCRRGRSEQPSPPHPQESHSLGLLCEVTGGPR